MEIVRIQEKLLRGPILPFTPTVGSWIAGGAVRRMFTGNEELSDIDVFCVSDEAESAFIAQALEHATEQDKTTNARNFTLNGVRVQVIQIRFATIADLFAGFDFTCCLFALDVFGHVHSTPEAMASVLRGHLAVHIIQPGRELDSLRRAFKYAKKGFEPCAGTLADLAKALGLGADKIEQQLEPMSPSGSRVRGIVRFD